MTSLWQVKQHKDTGRTRICSCGLIFWFQILAIILTIAVVAVVNFLPEDAVPELGKNHYDDLNRFWVSFGTVLLGFSAFIYLDSFHDNLRPEPYSIELDDEEIQTQIDMLRPLALQAAERSWEEKSPNLQLEHSREQFYVARAHQLIQLAEDQGVNPITSSQLDVECSPWQRRLFRFVNHKLWVWFIYVVLCVDAFTVFCDYEDSTDGLFLTDTPTWLCCLKCVMALLEFFTIMCDSIPYFFWKIRNEFMPSTRPLTLGLSVFFGLLHVVDTLLEFHGYSLDNMMPIATILILLRSHLCFKILIIFIKSIYRAAKLIYYFLFYMVIVAGVGHLLYQQGQFLEEVPDGAAAREGALQINRNVRYFRSTLITTFLAEASATMGATTRDLPFSALYFVILVVGGTLVIRAAMVAAFGSEFEWFEDNNTRREVLRVRMAYIIAYILADTDGSGGISRKEFLSFCRKWKRGKITDSKFMAVFAREIEDRENVELSCRDWISALHRMAADDSFRIYLASRNSFSSSFRSALQGPVIRILMHMVVFAQLMTIPLYHFLSTEPHRRLVSFIALGLACMHLVHLTLRVLAAGPARFLWPTSYERHLETQQFANRLDLIIMGFVAGMAGFLALGNVPLTSAAVQAVLAITIFRVMVFRNDLRDISYMLSCSVRPFFALMVVLFCIILQVSALLQAWLATSYRAEKAYHSRHGSDGLEARDWDSVCELGVGGEEVTCYKPHKKIEDGMWMLLAVFMEDNTNNTLYALKKSLGMPVVYFVLGFWMLMGLLFADVLFGMIVTLFGEMYDTWREEGKVEVRNPQQKMIQELL